MENMLATKICMSYELSETILLSGLHYLQLDLFRLLHRYLSLYGQFYLNVFQGKIAPPPRSGRQVFLPQSTNHTSSLSFRFLKVVYSDYSMIMQLSSSVNETVECN